MRVTSKPASIKLWLRLLRTAILCPATLAAALVSAQAGVFSHGVAAGLLNVEQISVIDSNVANVTLALGINNFRPDGGNRGDYPILVGMGPDASSDDSLGVFMTCVAENGRDNFGSNGYPVCSFTTNGSGFYRIISFLGQAGGGAGSSIEYNVNVAGALFPYDRYLGGFARNSTDANGGTNNTFTGSPGLVLGTHFKGVTDGVSKVDLRSLGIDSRNNGVLLVCHAKEEANFALSQVNTTDGTWNLFVRDSVQPSYSSYEQDPVAFVFIPKTNTALVSGRFRADGTIEMFSGTTPQFTITNTGVGTWDLRIPGHSSTNGVLIISPEGGGNQNGDNIVSYQPYGDHWEIQSRDTPDNGLQTPTGDPVASFVYIPQPPPGVTVSPTNGLATTGSGGTATFTVVLDAPPTADVNITLTSSDAAKGTAAPSILTFGAADWHKPKTVTVTGKPGATDGNYTITLSPAISSDTRYQGLNPADVSVLSLPARATLVWPAANALQVTTSPLLQALVTNTTPGNLTVQFYGRLKPTVLAGPDFSIAVMPDTQMYTAEKNGGKKEMFIAQAEWVITNRAPRNIAYVTQLGDIVNDGDIYLGLPNLTQWQNATNAMYRQENPTRTQLPYGIPYGVAVGNHEMEPIGTPSGTTTFYNQYFGISHFNGRPYYAGHYGTNNNNHFDLFSAGGLDFVVIYFEYNPDPQPALLAWGNDILRSYPTRRAIIVSHNFGNTATPINVSSQWVAIYNALKTNSNVFLMLAGHVTGQGARQDTFNGNTIRTYVQDYQGWVNGGNGFMRLFQFSPSNNVVVVQTFSPWTGEYLTDEASEFFFDYDLQPTGPGAPSPFTTLVTNIGVSPGSLSTCSWPELQPDKAYEWYVTVTDQSGRTVASPVWRFTTGLTNTPPSVVSLNRTIAGDAPTSLLLPATDLNADPLTFQIDTYPTHGLLQNFDPASGAISYWPAHGFRGYDWFTFTASDGQASSPVGVINLNVITLGDSNQNGLPDDWEAAYGISDPNADADADGRSNLEEFLANTNPTNAASVFRILTAAPQTNSSFGLTWAAIGGTRYRVQFSNADTNGGLTDAFTEIVRPITTEMDTNPIGSPSTQSWLDTFTDTGAATNGARYYRIKVVP